MTHGRVLMFAFLSPFCCGSILDAADLDPPKLTSLRRGCGLEFRRGSRPHPMLWLACGSYGVVLLGRASLEGQLSIRTGEQALEFARLFTTTDTWHLGQERMVEVTPGSEAQPFEFVVPKEQFARCCVEPRVKAAGGTKGSPWFEVQRTVVDQSDYGVYSLTELVGPDGRLVTREKRLLTKEGRQLGKFADPYVE